jgi:2-haloacid dehalogenase
MREIVTFDAYCTLVDFSLDAPTAELLKDRIAEVGVDTQEFLDTFNIMRFQAVLEDYRPYEEALRSSLKNSMRRHGLRYQDSDGDAIVALIPSFGPFPEVPEALRRLKNRYEIAIISNTQDHLIEKDIELIGVDFDHVITTAQARAYKPSRETFEGAVKCTFAVGVPHTGHGTASAPVRAVTTTASPPSATSSMITTGRPENTVATSELTSITRS